MKQRLIKGLPDFLLSLIIVLVSSVSPVLGAITAMLFFGSAVTCKPRKRPEPTQEVTYVENQWVYVGEPPRKTVN